MHTCVCALASDRVCMLPSPLMQADITYVRYRRVTNESDLIIRVAGALDLNLVLRACPCPLARAALNAWQRVNVKLFTMQDGLAHIYNSTCDQKLTLGSLCRDVKSFLAYNGIISAGTELRIFDKGHMILGGHTRLVPLYCPNYQELSVDAPRPDNKVKKARPYVHGACICIYRI